MFAVVADPVFDYPELTILKTAAPSPPPTVLEEKLLRYTNILD